MGNARTSPCIAVSKIPIVEIWRRPAIGRRSESNALRRPDVISAHAETGLESRLLGARKEFRHGSCTCIVCCQGWKVPSRFYCARDGVVSVGDRWLITSLYDWTCPAV